MKVSIRALLLLKELEIYIPYMSEEEIRLILITGSVPSKIAMASWELKREVSHQRKEKVFQSAYNFQRKGKTAD